MKLNVVKDHVKDIQSGYCGSSQLYFYNCLFSPNNDSKLLDRTNPSKNTVHILLNELLLLYQDYNERILKEYTNKNSIKNDLSKILCLFFNV